MRVGEEVVLECPVGTLRTVYPFLMAKAEDKTVLNVGAAGNASVYLPDRSHLWLHTQLIDTADDVIGLDIDPEEIGNAAEHGILIEEGNCEDAELGRLFDLIVMLEVIEHVDNLGAAIHNLLDHLNSGGGNWL
ncbi:MAG TPA: methyltransferase domain-containing protein [Sneathiellales bacterium]|nr:methyltransferase domain-containing protein [Sneathiellales bacterium]